MLAPFRCEDATPESVHAFLPHLKLSWRTVLFLRDAGSELANCGVMLLATPSTLGDAKGMTLYIFVRDEPGKSNCNGRCAESLVK